VTTWPVADSVDALVADASIRTPVEFDGSKSGARFERVVLHGARFLLKHVDVRDDWIMRQTGDIGCIPIRVWEGGVFDLLPECIDHTTVGAAREGARGAVLMRDVGEWLLPAGDEAIPADQHLRILDHLAALHAATWGWEDAVGLLPLANRYSFFGPDALNCEAALGFPQPVPRIAIEGWKRLDDASPELADALRPLRHAPWPLFDALADTPVAFLHGDTKAANLGHGPDGRTIMIDWSQSGAGPPLAEIAHSLALNRARIPRELARDATVDAYRAALERRRVDTSGWFERQLSLCLVGVMLQLAWEKAFDATGLELAWWRDRTVDTARELVRT
jgi:Phosphotransferase enzyme family